MNINLSNFVNKEVTVTLYNDTTITGVITFLQNDGRRNHHFTFPFEF